WTEDGSGRDHRDDARHRTSWAAKAIARPRAVIDGMALQHLEGVVYLEVVASLERGSSVMLAVARVHTTVNSGRARNHDSPFEGPHIVRSESLKSSAFRYFRFDLALTG